MKEEIIPGKTPSLIFCLFMDAVGFTSYFLPYLGEWTDALWAPVSAYIFYLSFGGKVGKIGSFINLVEELLPFTDIVPTFCLAYIYKRVTGNK